jgi:prevent-host-death family protein
MLASSAKILDMNKVMSATKAKNNFGEVIEEVYVKGNTLTIERNKKPVVRIVPIEPKPTKKTTPSLKLTDKEYEKVLEGAKEFRKTFKFSF